MPEFTYSGPSTAATFVTGVFNDAVDRADSQATDAASEFTDAANLVDGIPASNAEALAPVATIAATTIDLSSLLGRQGEIDGTLIEIGTVLDGLVDKVDSFMTQFFPDVEDAVAAARAQLVTLFSGDNMADGRGLAQLKIAEVQEKGERNHAIEEREIINRFAARGFRGPPGRLALALMQHQRDSSHEIVDAARNFDREGGEREASALIRMLELLRNTRAKALSAFSSFLARACTDKFDAQRITTDARIAEFMMLEDSLKEQLELTNRAAGVQLRAKEQNYGISHDYLAAIDKLVEAQAQAQLQAALGLAKNLGSLAAQAYNNLRGSASIGLSESMTDL